MEIPFAKQFIKPRIDPDAVELALDLTAEAITLYERPPHGAWKKFASAQLDDSEFPIVIGLLRTEAESYTGGHRPVRLWLPGEQVLKQRARIDGKTPAARRQATFDYIDRETVYRPDDVAVAIGPPDRDGETTLLITFAETWREARGYAARWGFIPGEVSTRHNAGDFGSEGPAFQLHSTPPQPATPANRNRLAIAALAVTVIAAGSAAWTLRPWEMQSGPPEMAPGGAVEVAQAPPIAQPPVPKPVKAGPAPTPEPETRAGAVPSESPVPPKHFSRTAVLSPPGDTDHPSAVSPSSAAFEIPTFPNALTIPAALGPAPLPLPDPEPAPLERDSIAKEIDAAWSGPAPETQPGDLSSPLAAKEIDRVMEPQPRIQKVTLLSNGKTPPRQPPTAPKIEPRVEPPPAEPIATPKEATVASASAVAPLNVPVPVPAPHRARVGTVARGVDIVEPNPTPKVIPRPRPARLAIPETKTETGPKPAAPPVTATGIPAEIPPLAPPEAQPLDPPTKFASLISPLPRKRPAPPRTLPTAATLPAITGSTQRTIRATATESGLPLDQTVLIGILNLDTGRKALLRLPGGRYRSVIVGDVLDGWRVSIIGTDAMRVTRGGKDQTLLLINR